jgi:hypothetical protein
MGKRKREPLTLAEAAKAPKRKRRTKKEMETARALAFAVKRETVEAVYPAEGYPFALCPVCGTIPLAQQKKRTLPALVLKHDGQTFTIYRSIYPCARSECKTDVICFISRTLNQRDISWFIDPKRLKGGKDSTKLPEVIRQNTGQPNTSSERKAVPDQASPKKKVKRKQ